jgi:hypothetical protein
VISHHLTPLHFASNEFCTPQLHNACPCSINAGCESTLFKVWGYNTACLMSLCTTEVGASAGAFRGECSPAHLQLDGTASGSAAADESALHTAVCPGLISWSYVLVGAFTRPWLLADCLRVHAVALQM